jgi:hypothetical protein
MARLPLQRGPDRTIATIPAMAEPNDSNQNSAKFMRSVPHLGIFGAVEGLLWRGG